MLPEFADGIRVAELAPLSDPGPAPVTVATALGLKFAAGAISAERVANALGTSQLVLVLDNCEHVIDAAATIAEALLRAHSTIRVLATSREPLRTEGEYLYRVPPLAVPAADVEDTEEMLQAGAGGGSALFAGRAHCSYRGGDLPAARWYPAGDRVGGVDRALCPDRSRRKASVREHWPRSENHPSPT